MLPCILVMKVSDHRVCN